MSETLADTGKHVLTGVRSGCSYNDLMNAVLRIHYRPPIYARVRHYSWGGRVNEQWVDGSVLQSIFAPALLVHHAPRT